MTRATVNIARVGGRVYGQVPFNPAFNADIKKIGGKWDYRTKSWHLLAEDEPRMRELAHQHFGTDGR